VTRELPAGEAPAASREAVLKCVVWDLDRTVWNGVLLENPQVGLRPGVAEVIETLDRRGILQSVASRNEPAPALARLEAVGLRRLFLHPQIHWGAKSSSLETIASALDIGIGSLALVDDDPYERDEVRHAFPAVRCYDASETDHLLARPEFQPSLVTEEARQRRRLYLREQERERAEREHAGTPREFLATLGLRLTVTEAAEGDLLRAHELTVRTHQLNTTGVTYSQEELEGFRRSERHRLLMAELDDRYGSYGKIGLALLRCDDAVWTIQLLLLSCRVLSRGVGTVLIRHLVDLAAAAGVRLRAEFVESDRNRIMYVTYRFAGFQEIAREGSLAILESVPAKAPAIPDHVTLWGLRA